MLIVSSHQNWQMKNWNLLKKETKNTWRHIGIIVWVGIPMLTLMKWRNQIQSRNMCMLRVGEKQCNWIFKKWMMRWMLESLLQIEKESMLLFHKLLNLIKFFVIIKSIKWVFNISGKAIGNFRWSWKAPSLVGKNRAKFIFQSSIVSFQLHRVFSSSISTFQLHKSVSNFSCTFQLQPELSNFSSNFPTSIDSFRLRLALSSFSEILQLQTFQFLVLSNFPLQERVSQYIVR